MKPKVQPEPVEGLSPRQVKTPQELHQLRRTDFDTPDYWLLVDVAIVTIAKLHTGHSAEQIIEIKRSDFDQMVDWYNRVQT